MATETGRIAGITTIDRAQWQPHEYPLAGHLVHFAQIANAVVLDGPLAGWFDRPLTRQYSYAPFNARVVENYRSLAFFAGHAAPWNPYYRDPDVLHRLALVLRYVFALQDERGALPEYAPAAIDTPMLAPSSFGAEYMAASLDVAGEVLPTGLRDDLAAAARRAAHYVLTAAESWEHARSYSNQFIGAMVAAAKLADLTGDRDLPPLIERGMTALLNEFIAGPGYLYEADGPETFGYFFVTLPRLAALAALRPDPRLTETVRRHCAWMARWMLPELDGTAITLANAHHTRTVGRDLLTPNIAGDRDALTRAAFGLHWPWTMHGMGAFLADAPDERRFLRLFFAPAEAVAGFQQAWETEPDLLAAYDWRHARGQYSPVSTLAALPPYAPTFAEQTEARAALPAWDATPRAEELRDDKGNHYIFARTPHYYAAFGQGVRRGEVRFGPQFLWSPAGGTLIHPTYGGGAWETYFADGTGTGRADATLTMRREGETTEVIAQYPAFGATKMFVLEGDAISVRLSSAEPGGQVPHERVPLLLRESDVLRVDYGSCAVSEFYDTNTGGFGVVSRTVAVEREGRTLLTFDFLSPVTAIMRRGEAFGDRVSVELTFSYAPVFYRRAGYRVLVGR